MSHDKNNPVKLVITQDKLVDLLMHAATREDISTLRKEVTTDIAALRKEMNTKFDKVDAKIDKVDAKMDWRFKFLMRTMIGGFFSLAGIFIASVGFLVKYIH